MTRAIPDLDIDLGRLPDEPPALYSLARRVNVACGGQAVDTAPMRAACALAAAAGAQVGAHPGYEDPEGPDRVPAEVSPDALRASVARQCAALADAARAHGLRVKHVKPRGELYDTAARDPAVARAVVLGAVDALGPVEVLGPPTGALRDAALALGMAYVREGFADRRYLDDGTLVPRTEPGALHAEPAAAAVQAVSLALTGGFDTLCVHGDHPHAEAVARAVRAALDAFGTHRG